MLDASVVGCTEREHGSRQHAQFVQADQFWGHWAQKRQDAQGRVSSLSPEVILGQATGRALDPLRLRRALRLRQLTRTVRQYGQMRLHNFARYVDHGLGGQPVEVLVYNDMVRIEQSAQLVVSYPCVYDPRQQRITEVDASGRQQYSQVPVMQLVLLALVLGRTVWRMPLSRRTTASQPALPALQISLWSHCTD